MLRSFFIITLRILWRNKITSFVNIFSLTIGMAAFILIMMYIHHETSYDKFNENYSRIYRIEGDEYAKLPPVVGTYVKDHFPEVENMTRLSLGIEDFIIYTPENDPENIKQVSAFWFYADSTVFNVFTIPFLSGYPESALKRPFTIVLSETKAISLFGNSNALGKSVDIEGHHYEVTGIIREVKYSHIKIEALISQETVRLIYPDRNLNLTGPNSWLWSATYLLMENEIDQKSVEKKINLALAEINDGTLFDTEFKNFRIRPLKDIYFYGSLPILDYGFHGNPQLIRVLLAVAIFILLLAIINYANLTTAWSMLRTKELAIKKVVGSSVLWLRYQLVFESIIVSFIAFLLAITLVQAFLSPFNMLTGAEISLIDLNRSQIWILSAFGVVLIGIIAGIYPSLYLTSFSTTSLMKGVQQKNSGNSRIRLSLMTFQFALSIVLIIAVIVNFRQLQYARKADIGFNKEKVVMIKTPSVGSETESLRKTFDDRLTRLADISAVSYCVGRPGGTTPTIPIDYEEKITTIEFYCIDPDYLNVMGMQIVQGRNFSIDIPGDKSPQKHIPGNIYGILINETGVKQLGIKDPVGKWISGKGMGGDIRRWKIIGVVKDFHFKSIHHKIEPLAMGWTRPEPTAVIRISSSDIPSTLKSIEREYREIYGSKPFAYEFLDEAYDQQYKNDERLGKVIGYFSILAIIIACLGLFALSTFMVSRRTKEIGIRKSMGASVLSIYRMLSWDYIKWVLIAILIALPVSGYIMHQWLNTFAYHTPLSIDVFIFGAMISIIIAIATITRQTLKSAFANPVDALRYE